MIIHGSTGKALHTDYKNLSKDKKTPGMQYCPSFSGMAKDLNWTCKFSQKCPNIMPFEQLENERGWVMRL